MYRMTDTKTIGEFQEKDFKQWFTISKTDNEFAKANGLDFEIDVLDGVRYAKILKTVAYVAVDEDEVGKPVLEKWDLAKLHWFNA